MASYLLVANETAESEDLLHAVSALNRYLYVTQSDSSSGPIRGDGRGSIGIGGAHRHDTLDPSSLAV